MDSAGKALWGREGAVEWQGWQDVTLGGGRINGGSIHEGRSTRKIEDPALDLCIPACVQNGHQNPFWIHPGSTRTEAEEKGLAPLSFRTLWRQQTRAAFSHSLVIFAKQV